MPNRIYGLAVLAIVAAAGCKHPTDLLLQTGTPYSLRTINGQLLPYAMNGTSNGPMVTGGEFTFLSGNQATRMERSRRPSGAAGDSVISNWTQPGTFYQQLGRIVVRYDNWPPLDGGPRMAADTLIATKSGGYILKDGGLQLLYCPGGRDC